MICFKKGNNYKVVVFGTSVVIYDHIKKLELDDDISNYNNYKNGCTVLYTHNRKMVEIHGLHILFKFEGKETFLKRMRIKLKKWMR